MKHIKLASAIAFVMGIAAAGSAMADGGTITFNGSVSDQTCIVKGGPGTDGGTGNFTVALPQTTTGELSDAGKTSSAMQPFSMQFSAGVGTGACTEGTVAHVSFLTSGPRIDPITGALSNALSGEATNTEIQLLQADGKTAINLADPTNNTDITLGANGNATLSYNARYLATGQATAGLISTSVVYGVTYN
jgi:major type 1 subunit fimbrin (pilin)